jgi:polyhydroxybutyrate depolymerase
MGATPALRGDGSHSVRTSRTGFPRLIVRTHPASRATSLSAPATAAYFAARNGITAQPVTTELPASSRATSVDRTDYRQPGRPPVVLYTVHGGGHTVPGPAKAPAVLGRTNHDINTAGLVEDVFAL